MTEAELIELVATRDLRHLRTADLLAEVDFATYELGSLAQQGDYDSDYAQYIEKRARVLSGELERRSKIIPIEDTRPTIPADFIISLKAAVDLEDVFNRYLGILCRPTGQTRSEYACPAHPDKHPSGVIYRDQGRYHCFQCHASGDCYDALMAFKGMNFVDAVETLAAYMNTTIPRPVAKAPAKGLVAL